MLGAIVVSYAVTRWSIGAIDPDLSEAVVDLIAIAAMAVLSSIPLWFGLIRPMRAHARHQDFDRRLHSALQMVQTETEGYEVVRRATEVAQVPGRVQLLLADSSQAHLKTVLHHGDAAVPVCGVVGPYDCPAIRRGQTTRFESSAELDACPRLHERATAGELAAACIPLNIVGRSIGVLHVATPVSRRLKESQVAALESVAEEASVRFGIIRVMEATHLQAATDPLTGLLNRRSLENKAHDLLRSGDQFAVAMGDLDHFKNLNDTHGHDAGDRALRAFARTLRGALRGDDIVSRYGGEEFVIVFPGLSARDAAGALERVREALALAVTEGSVPPFTASFGVADSRDASSLEELLRVADTALFQAKRQGRNRVVLDRATTTP
jgi:diguanylate cyclase (GGDEF)-like protein